MRFRCPECEKPLKVGDEKAGKRGRCPACKTIVTVPYPKEALSRPPVQKHSTPPPLPTPEHMFHMVQETGKKHQWQLSLYKDRLILHCPETGALVEILRDQAIDKMNTVKLFFVIPVLMVKEGQKFSYRLKPEEFEIVNEWIGKPLLLKKTLKQRLGWCLPIGIMYMITSIPIPGDPAENVEAIPFDPIGMGLGIVLIFFSILMRKKPRPSLFLADSAWFFLLLCYTLVQIFSGASIFWGGLIGIHIFLIASGIRHYRYFSDVRPV